MDKAGERKPPKSVMASEEYGSDQGVEICVCAPDPAGSGNG
jgi:hypothetical protein